MIPEEGQTHVPDTSNTRCLLCVLGVQIDHELAHDTQLRDVVAPHFIYGGQELCWIFLGAPLELLQAIQHEMLAFLLQILIQLGPMLVCAQSIDGPAQLLKGSRGLLLVLDGVDCLSQRVP